MENNQSESKNDKVSKSGDQHCNNCQEVVEVDDYDSDLNLSLRVMKMTVMWTACSFGSHLLNFMNKYLEGSIFTNNYVEGCAGGLACIIASSLYSKFGMKKTFLIAFGLSFFGGITVCLLEGGIVHLP
jgi:hypothetical protein